VYFFVFEFGTNNNSEFAFQSEIISLLNFPTELYIYGKDLNFFEKLKEVNIAIASRYHANIIWQKKGIPVLPIPYAPKVYSLYKKYGIDILPISESIDNTDKLFQSINLQDEYSLPDNFNEIYHLTKYKKLLLISFELLASVQEIITSMTFRIKEI
jgi:polysaccharide pyruvyl transferase WcaK-like protein